jgi:hypothetical protein
VPKNAYTLFILFDLGAFVNKKGAARGAGRGRKNF